MLIANIVFGIFAGLVFIGLVYDVIQTISRERRGEDTSIM